ncbi:beta-ketoacyl-ACP synthase II [Tepidiforma sp.]|uniref:beta-ketoacyl-ACP synthase II n=1 Tax=Tepidiforma sp. TaxID=2682230 RepID=UPI002ADDC539|nr:beta-ketoacyl-ACP synthase II [Tepidiforma sp.]
MTEHAPAPARRVVVTGLGIVSPLGHNACDTWSALLAARSGTRRITLFDPEGFDSAVAGEVPDFDPAAYMDRKEARRADRATQFAIVAADEALRQSGYRPPPGDGREMAIIVGTAIGGITTLVAEYETMRAKGPGRVSPFLMPMMLSDMTSGQLSIRLGARGVNYCLVSACASGADSIGEAANIIRRGDAEIALAGGTEAPITPIVVAGFASARALTTANDHPEHASRPFDLRRDGFVIAEGAAILVLESEEHARARGAEILAELAGYGATSDAYHITQPDEQGEGAARAMQLALRQAGLQPDDIDYLNAHGTSTPINDRLETLAIKRVFGEYAYDLPISSSKSMTGHLLGAAGAVEAAISVLALRNQVIPPTANYEVPDPDCDLDYVPNVPRPARIDAVMSNSLGFGGHNSSLIFRTYRPAP